MDLICCREYSVEVGYAIKIAPTLGLGATAGVHARTIKGYGSVFSPLYTVHMMHKIGDELIVGLQLRNILGFGKELNNRAVPPLFETGIRFSVSPTVAIHTSVSGLAWSELRFEGGISYTPLDLITIRTGASTNPAQFHFGFGLRIRARLRIDSAISYNTVLGVTPTIGITFMASSYEGITDSGNRE